MTSSLWRRLRATATRSGPGCDRPHVPRHGDQFEQWLKDQRDKHVDAWGANPTWYALDDLLDEYRRHADTRTPLGQDVRDDAPAEHPF